MLNPNLFNRKDLIFIPGNVPSKKNSKAIFWKNGRMSGAVQAYRKGTPVTPFIMSSKNTSDYEVRAKGYFFDKKKDFRQLVEGKSFPLKIAFHFIRDSRRKFDFGNACQVLLDMMQDFDWIEDDDMTHVLPYPLIIDGDGYTIDKEKAGVIIKIL